MKKILVLVFITLLVGCSKNSLVKSFNIEEDSPVLKADTVELTQEEVFELSEPFKEVLSESISIIIDPKIEATYLIAHLLSDETGYEIYFDESSYVTDQVERFSGYKNHEVFSILKKMIMNGFSYDAISGTLHYYSDDLELIEGLIPDEKIIERAGGEEQIKEFLEALYDFRKVSKYDNYFREEEEYFKILLSRAKKHIVDSNMEQVFLNYYGEYLGELIVVITPVCPMGFGNRLEFEDKQILMPTLPVSIYEDDYVAFLLHEISHSYVNPQTELRYENVAVLEELFLPIKTSMSNQAYSSWSTCFNEHVVRANVAIMLEEIYGELAREKAIYHDEKRDFIYLSNVISSLENYRASRENYPVFHMYYDIIIENLKNEL